MAYHLATRRSGFRYHFQIALYPASDYGIHQRIERVRQVLCSYARHPGDMCMECFVEALLCDQRLQAADILLEAWMALQRGACDRVWDFWTVDVRLGIFTRCGTMPERLINLRFTDRVHAIMLQDVRFAQRYIRLADRLRAPRGDQIIREIIRLCPRMSLYGSILVATVRNLQPLDRYRCTDHITALEAVARDQWLMRYIAQLALGVYDAQMP